MYFPIARTPVRPQHAVPQSERRAPDGDVQDQRGRGDERMPFVGGLEVLEKLEVLGLFETFPVAVFTAHKESDIVRKAIKLGALDDIVKPFEMKELGRRVSDLIFKKSEPELKTMIANLRMSDPSLFRASGLQKWANRGYDPYLLTENEKTICILLPTGQSPGMVGKLPLAELVQKVVILRKCAFGYQTVWPTASSALVGTPAKGDKAS